jgi:hypothetical protein
VHDRGSALDEYVSRLPRGIKSTLFQSFPGQVPVYDMS